MTTAAPAQRTPALSSLSNLRAIATRLALPALLLLPVLLYLPFLNEPFERDEGAYATIAQNLLHGAVPYRDLFDHKPPLTYLWYAASFLLFGENIAAPRIAAALVWSATSLLVYFEARLLFARRTAVIAAGVFSASCGLAALSFNANTEVFTLPWLVAGLIGVTKWQRTGDRRWLLAAGACGALASLTKQTAALNLLALLFVVTWPDLKAQRLRTAIASALTLSVGSALALAVVVAPFVLAGATGDFFYSTVVYNQIYTSQLTVLERLQFTALGLEFFVLVAAPLIGLLVMALLELRRRSWMPADTILIPSLAAAWLGVMTSGYFFPHYLLLMLPFVALFLAPFIEKRVTEQTSRRGFLLVTVAMVGLAAAFSLQVFFAGSPEDIHRAKFLDPGATQDNQSRIVADYIVAHTTPDQAIYEYGRTTQIYFLSDRRPAVRYMYDRPFWLDENTLGEALVQLEAAKPAYIFDTIRTKDSDEWQKFHPPRVQAFFAAHYEFVEHIAYADVYRLRSAG
jgi:4-amino-4-deoxy-L-arabinose transferase-like glycosyltransferase